MKKINTSSLRYPLSGLFWGLFWIIFATHCAVKQPQKTTEVQPPQPPVAPEAGKMPMANTQPAIDTQRVADTAWSQTKAGQETPGDSLSEASHQDSLPLPQVCMDAKIMLSDSIVSVKNKISCIKLLMEQDSLGEAKSLLNSLKNEPKTKLQAYEMMFLKGKLFYISGQQSLAKDVWEKINQDSDTLKAILEQTQSQLQTLSLISSIENGQLKKEVQMIYQKYFQGVHHPEISKMAIEILKKSKIKELRTEIKKLVQKAWERDGKFVLNKIAEIKNEFDLTNNRDESLQKLKELKSKFQGHHAEAMENIKQYIHSGVAIPTESEGNPEALYQKADSLVQIGDFLAAKKIIQDLKGTPYQQKAQVLNEKSGNLFCTRKRKIASEKFSTSKSKSKEQQLILLGHAKAELESCLENFPHLSIAKKVKKNLVMINKRTEKLKLEQSSP